MTSEQCLGRHALETLLGRASFGYSDRGDGLRAALMWPCGCSAREVGSLRERFTVLPCREHERE